MYLATFHLCYIGIMCVLSLATLSFDVRNDIPSVPYVTALDWFLIMCYLFLFASLLEFTIVHYFTKVGYGDYMIIENESLLDEELEQQFSLTKRMSGAGPFKADELAYEAGHFGELAYTRSSMMGQDRSGARAVKKTYLQYNLERFWKCVTSDPIYKKLIKKKADDKGINSVSKCDKVSRILFPGLFLFLNFIYWNTYYKSK
jgi:gamma-aminobutyric acid receptor subunit alpha